MQWGRCVSATGTCLLKEGCSPSAAGHLLGGFSSSTTWCNQQETMAQRAYVAAECEYFLRQAGGCTSQQAQAGMSHCCNALQVLQRSAWHVHASPQPSTGILHCFAPISSVLPQLFCYFTLNSSWVHFTSHLVLW